MPDIDYHIQVRGRLPEHWGDAFAPLALSRGPDGTTDLRGPLPDQAALHGILGRLRDLGVELLLVECSRGRRVRP